METVFLFLGFAGGIFLSRWFWRDLLRKGQNYDDLKEKYVALDTLRQSEKNAYAEKIREWEQIESKLNESFKSISLDLFHQNARSFLGLAEESLKKYDDHSKTALESQRHLLDQSMLPLKENLVLFQKRIQDIETTRVAGEAALKQQLETLNELQLRLETKTVELSRSLRDPNAKGRWGELQLRRAVEYAGMLEYVDFEVQKSVDGAEGVLRPDMVIHLPNDRTVVVDAKSPLFDEIVQASDIEENQKALKTCGHRIRETIVKLGSKSYWADVQNAPDFVVLFFPGEWLLSTILKEDASLIEHASKNSVILATPTTLIALLKAVSYGWKQAEMAKEAKEISKLGGEMYERMWVFFNYFQDLRKHLVRVAETYNQMVGSIESRILPSAGRLQTFSRKNATLPPLELFGTELRSSSKWSEIPPTETSSLDEPGSA